MIHIMTRLRCNAAGHIYKIMSSAAQLTAVENKNGDQWDRSATITDSPRGTLDSIFNV